jgi:hypothetical protein
MHCIRKGSCQFKHTESFQNQTIRNNFNYIRADTIDMLNRINQHSYTILANRSFAQVECNQNPNENIYSKRNRLVIRIIEVNKIVLNLFEPNQMKENPKDYINSNIQNCFKANQT